MTRFIATWEELAGELGRRHQPQFQSTNDKDRQGKRIKEGKGEKEKTSTYRNVTTIPLSNLRVLVHGHIRPHGHIFTSTMSLFVCI